MGLLTRGKAKKKTDWSDGAGPAIKSGTPTATVDSAAPPASDRARQDDRIIDLVGRSDPTLGLAVKKLREGGHLHLTDAEAAVYPSSAHADAPVEESVSS